MRIAQSGAVLSLAVFAFFACSAAQAQLPSPPSGVMGMIPSPLAGPMAGLAFMSTPEGQQELKLSDEQKGTLQQYQENFRSRLNDHTAPAGQVAKSERPGKNDALLQEFADEVNQEIQQILDADQFRRYKQVGTQAFGFAAFNQPAIQKALQLTDEQKSKIAVQQDLALAATRAAFEKNLGDREAAVKAVTEVRDQTMARLKGFLSEDQKKTWEGLVGKPFQMPQIGQPRRSAN